MSKRVIDKTIEIMNACGVECNASLFFKIATYVECESPYISEAVENMSRYHCSDDKTLSKLIEVLEREDVRNKDGYIATIFRNEKEMRS